MKRTILLLTVLLILLSCDEKESNLDTYSYTFTENSELIITTIEESYMRFGSVEEGQNLVFKYRFKAHDEVQIADDEYAETIQFEIDPQLENFNYLNQELMNSNLVFAKHCFCFFPFDELKNVDPIGIISGKKISNKEWNISINVTFYGDEERNISGIFKLK